MTAVSPAPRQRTIVTNGRRRVPLRSPSHSPFPASATAHGTIGNTGATASIGCATPGDGDAGMRHSLTSPSLHRRTKPYGFAAGNDGKARGSLVRYGPPLQYQADGPASPPGGPGLASGECGGSIAGGTATSGANSVANVRTVKASPPQEFRLGVATRTSAPPTPRRLTRTPRLSPRGPVPQTWIARGNNHYHAATGSTSSAYPVETSSEGPVPVAVPRTAIGRAISVTALPDSSSMPGVGCDRPPDQKHGHIGPLKPHPQHHLQQQQMLQNFQQDVDEREANFETPPVPSGSIGNVSAVARSAASCASGATTPTEGTGATSDVGGPGSTGASQVGARRDPKLIHGPTPDSRIMKLIGRRSVLRDQPLQARREKRPHDLTYSGSKTSSSDAAKVAPSASGTFSMPGSDAYFVAVTPPVVALGGDDTQESIASGTLEDSPLAPEHKVSKATEIPSNEDAKDDQTHAPKSTDSPGKNCAVPFKGPDGTLPIPEDDDDETDSPAKVEERAEGDGSAANNAEGASFSMAAKPTQAASDNSVEVEGASCTTTCLPGTVVWPGLPQQHQQTSLAEAAAAALPQPNPSQVLSGAMSGFRENDPQGLQQQMQHQFAQQYLDQYQLQQQALLQQEQQLLQLQQMQAAMLQGTQIGSEHGSDAALLQNEAGSIVAPHTWRFVPPPAHLLPLMDKAATMPAPPLDAAAVPEPAAVVKAGETAGSSSTAKEAGATSAVGLAAAAVDAIREPSPAAKRQLLTELVDRLVQHATTCEKQLAAEQRANLALRAAMENLQRQNLYLQQQLGYAT